MKRILFPILALILAFGLAIPMATPTGAHTEGNPKVVILYAGQDIDVGTVSVWDDSTNLYVKYETNGGWEMTETHLIVTDNWSEIPLNKGGNPKVGHFPDGDDYDPPVSEDTFTFNLDDEGWASCTTLYIAAHADLEKLGEVMTVTLASGTQTLPAGYTENTPVSDPLNPSNYIPGTWSTAVDLSSPHPSWYNENLLPGAVWVSSADSPEGNTANDQWRLFKEEFEIPAGAIITSASLVMSADNSVEAYLNSTSVGTADDAVFGEAPGPPFSDPEDYHFTFLWGPFDLNPVEGPNTLMLVVRNWASKGDNPTGLIYKMDYEYQLLFSETAWGDGDRFVEKGNWATYFEYEVQRVLSGTWLLNVNNGHYMHDMFIVTQSATGELTGYGGYPAGSGPTYPSPYNWTLTGQITGNSVTMTLDYQNSYKAIITGTVDSSWDSMSGGAGTGGVVNWEATRVP